MIFFIFTLALFLRFLYFPNNIYFGIDQAMSAYATKAILEGDLKLIGPSTSFEGLYHGSLFYYIFTPLYLLGNGDPAYVSAFLRILNAAGIFLLLAIGSLLFNKYVGLTASLIYAFSFEQTQFSIYLNHPSLAVLSILLMYLGFALSIFRNKKFGIVIAFLGLGLSFQFEFILTYLSVPFLILFFYFRKQLISKNLKIIFLSIVVFLSAISTYILAEIKFNFRSIHLLPQLLQNDPRSLFDKIITFIFEVGKMIKYNFSGTSRLDYYIAIFLLVAFVYFFAKKSQVRKQLIFLGVWFFSMITIYLVEGTDIRSGIPLYYPNVGISISLIIFVSYIVYLLYKSLRVLSLLILLFFLIMNIYLIVMINPKGSMDEINAQSGMLLSDEKRVLDYLYETSEGKSFAVKAVTMPYIINTTWSYLFGWYGKEKYGYLPIWGGQNAKGYLNELIVETAQDKLPEKRFLIVEPTRGIPLHLINDYIREENYFTKILEEKKIGQFIVQRRMKL